MKKYLIILFVFLIVVAGYGAITNSAHNSRATFQNGYAWTGHQPKDKATLWAQGVEDLASLGVQLGTGKIWYADSGVVTEGDGTSWTDAFDTIDEAINASGTDSGASRGDVILVAQGHNEGGSAADIFDADVIGHTIIGMGIGSLKPTVDFDGKLAECAIGAANVTIMNIRFRPSVTAVNIGLAIEASADYAHVLNCDFGFAETATDEFITALFAGTNTGCTIVGNLFDAGANTAVSAIAIDAATLTIIRNNTIIGDYSTASINNATTTLSNIIIEDNILWNGVFGGLNTEPAIELMSTAIGISRRNDVFCNVASVAAAFVGDGIFNRGNSYNETAGGASTSFALDMVAASTTQMITSVTAGDGE